jgi:fucose permease
LALVAVGLGTSMQFALIALRMIRFSGGRPDLAVGHSSLAAGIAIAGAPFMLGMLGDHLGISRAYLMVPILILITLSTIIALPSTKSDTQDAK